MKTIKVLFVIGFLNFMLMLGVLSAATVVNQKRFQEVQAPVVQSEVLTPTPSVAKVVRIIKVTPKIVNTPSTPSVKPTSAPVVNQNNVQSPVAQPVAVATSAPTAVPTAVQTAAPTAVADNRCIIAIDGAKYDITQFQFSHSGGNVFSCGTVGNPADLSSLFHSRHPDSFLNRMTQYKI